MPPSLSPLAVLSLLGAAHGVLLALALAGVKRGNAVANRLLAALTLTVSVFIFGAVLRTTGYGFQYPHLTRIHDPFPFLAGPLLYLYLRALSTGRGVFRTKALLHFVPFLLCALYLSPYFFLGAGQKLEILLAEYQEDGLGSWYYVRSALAIAHFLVYLTLAVRLLVRYSREARGRGSTIGAAVLSQARFLVVSAAVLCALGVLRYALDRTARTNLLIPFGPRRRDARRDGGRARRRQAHEGEAEEECLLQRRRLAVVRVREGRVENRPVLSEGGGL